MGREEVLAVLRAHEWRNWACSCGYDADDDQNPRDENEHLADALLPVLKAAIVAAEQRGREDNEDHGMCYVSGSRALEAIKAEAWDKGWVAGCDDRQYGDENAKPWTPNPYRTTTRPTNPHDPEPDRGSAP